MLSVEHVDHSQHGGVKCAVDQTHPIGSVTSYVLQEGSTWARFNSAGDIEPREDRDFGFYQAGRRYLSQFELFCDQQHLVVLHSRLDENEVLFSAELTNPDLYRKKMLIAPLGQLGIHRLMFLWQNRWFTRLVIENRSDLIWQGDCILRFDADFSETTATLQSSELGVGRGLPPVSRYSSVWMGNEEPDGTQHYLSLDFTPAPPDSSSSTIWVVKQLQPSEVVTFDLSVTCEPTDVSERVPIFDEALAAARSAAQEKTTAVS